MAARENFIDKYKVEGAYQKPVKDGEATQEYVHMMAQHIFSNYVRGVDAIGYDSREDFEKLRAYGAGRQPEDIYKPYFYGANKDRMGNTFNNEGVDIGGVSSHFDSREYAKKALAHMNWKVMSPMGKIKDKIHASFYGNAYDINIECVDENSIDEQQNAKWKAWVDSQQEQIDMMNQLKEITGIPYEEPTQRISSLTELELHEANGDFKLNFAKEGEKVIKDAWNISNQDELDQRILDDLSDINICAYRVYYDREIGKEMIRYVNPSNAGIQHSRHNDFRDSSYAYEVVFEPAHKLQQFGIDPKTLPSIAQNYAGMFGNPEWEGKYEWIGETEPLVSCGFFKVPVMDLEWIDVDVDKMVKYETSYGTKQIRPYQQGEKLSANKQYQETKIHKVYQCKWVVDTDILYDWGLKPNQPRREKNQAVLSFHFIKGKLQQSLVERLIPVLDDFQLTWLKYQDAKASAVKSGLAIEFGSLMGMKMGGGELSPFDLISIYRTTGDIFYRRNQRHLGTSQPMPITPMQGGMGNILNELVIALDTNAKMIEEITGINPVSLGSTADPRAGKAVMEMSVSNSSSPIKNIFDKVFLLKAHTSLDLLQRVQLDLRNSPTVRKRYAAVIGTLGVESLVQAEGRGVAFGFKLVARPSQDEMQLIFKYVEVALQAGKNGLPGITVPEAMYLTRRAKEGGSWEEIEMYLDFKEKQHQQEQQAYAQQAAQQQIEGQQQYAQINAENQRRLTQLEAEKEAYGYSAKTYYDMLLADRQSWNKINEINAQKAIGSTQQQPMPVIQAPDITIDGMTPEQIVQQQAAQTQQAQMQPNMG